MTSTNLDDDDSEKIIENLSYIYDSIYNSKFISLLENAKESDERILDSELENDFLESVNQTDTFLACAGYIWSKINAHKNYNEPSANFRKLIEALGDVALEHDNWDEGHIYRSLTQGVDVLKQIISVCEAAMADPELIDDFGYYNDLYRKTSKAINLVQKSPIYDVDGIA